MGTRGRIKGNILSVFQTVLITILFFLPTTAEPAELIPPEPLLADSTVDAGTSAAPDAAAADQAIDPGIDTTATVATASATSTGGEFGEAGSSVSPPTTNTFAGAASLSISITVPPGRLGLSPNISLNYNSMKGNGWMGIGWDFDMGSIQRNTKYGLDYTKNDFVFSKNGSSSELVNITGNEYRAKIEDGSFIRFFYDASSSSWTAYDKNGTVYYYGTTAGSRQDFSSGTKVFKWNLDKVLDSNGNYMIISYFKDQGEIYLDRIDYTGNTSGLDTTNYVKFYLESRTDVYPMYITNFRVLTAYRLKTIEVMANGQRVRVYALNYTISGITSSSILASVQQFGSDADLDASGTVLNGTAMPTMTFETPPFSNGFEDPVNWHDYIPVYSWSQFWLSDFNGDGKTDIMYLSRTSPLKYMVMLNNGNGFQDPVSWHDYIPIFSWSQFWLSDFNGDGKTDIMYLSTSPYKYMVMLNNGNGFQDPVSWHDYIPIFSWSQFWLSDFNGDGKTDIMYLSTSPYKYMVMKNNSSHDLVVSTSNGIGSIYTITYEPSSSYQNTLMPFILQTVSSITASDGIGNS
ncbi:MAG: SpvB/TcaC N-terminal domain-containing protein, partial [Nitrospirota bacterium]